MTNFTSRICTRAIMVTPGATVALCAAIAGLVLESADAANTDPTERSVSRVRVSLGDEGRRWTLVPTMHEGRVESFIALREGVAYGENFTTIWYRKVMLEDGTEAWETKAFADQDQSKAIRAVKDALALGDSTDESWPIAVAGIAASVPENMVKGLLETDALASLVADLEDPQPIVEMLEDAGWKAAWIDPLEGAAVTAAESDTVACQQEIMLATLEGIVLRAESEAPLTTSTEHLECLAVGAYPTCRTEGPAGPWIPSVGWNCGPWTSDTPTPLGNCMTQCNYKREVSRRRFRKITERNCYTGTVLGSFFQTQYETGEQTASIDVAGAAGLIQLHGSCNVLAGCPIPPVFAAGENPTCQPSGGTTQGPWLDP